MCVVVRLMAAAVVLLNAVPSLHDGVSEHQLPFAVRLALDKVHQAAARGGAGRQKEVSQHEDAIILLKHVRDGILLAQIMLVGRCVVCRAERTFILGSEGRGSPALTHGKTAFVCLSASFFVTSKHLRARGQGW